MDNYERLQALLTFIRNKFCGGKAAELARRIDRSDSYINRLFYPQRKNGAKGIGPEIMQACTEAFELPRGFWEMSPEEAAIELGEGRPTRPPSDQPAMPDGSILVDPSKAQRIWVVGKGAGGLSERIWTDGDHPVGATDQYGLVASTDPQAFLVEVTEESMVPKYTPGDFALVEPGTAPELEDDVLVRLTSGITMIKRLLSQRGQFKFGSYNNTAVLYYRAEDVDWIYYVAHPVPRRKIKSLW
ncbi:S24 family peptidase [Variovorax sp. AB1(2024)]|uniref:S24 family peptidase n=1 Tax=Variovorax sp. AB1(2024) TaxID=3132214 RepID=UPI0030A1CAD7